MLVKGGEVTKSAYPVFHCDTVEKFHKFEWRPNFGCFSLFKDILYAPLKTGAMLFETNSVETIEVGIVCVKAVHTSWWHICSSKNLRTWYQ